MSLSSILAASPGVYPGTGDGAESGPFRAHIEISRLPNAGVSLKYTAIALDQEVLHEEHSLLCTGPDGCDRLFIAHSESPFVTEMVETEDGSGRFAQLTPVGPYAMEVVIDIPQTGCLTYAWWWANTGEQPIEQSKAEVRLVPSDKL